MYIKSGTLFLTSPINRSTISLVISQGNLKLFKTSFIFGFDANCVLISGRISAMDSALISIFDFFFLDGFPCDLNAILVVF